MERDSSIEVYLTENEDGTYDVHAEPQEPLKLSAMLRKGAEQVEQVYGPIFLESGEYDDDDWAGGESARTSGKPGACAGGAILVGMYGLAAVNNLDFADIARAIPAWDSPLTPEDRGNWCDECQMYHDATTIGSSLVHRNDSEHISFADNIAWLESIGQ